MIETVVIVFIFWASFTFLAWVLNRFTNEYSYYSEPYHYDNSWLIKPRELNLEVYEIKIGAKKK